jgi:hypothetical protein
MFSNDNLLPAEKNGMGRSINYNPMIFLQNPQSADRIVLLFFSNKYLSSIAFAAHRTG